MASKISINLDTSKENFILTKCKQNDDLDLEASIYENGLALDLSNKEVIIQALKANNTYIIQTSGITKESNKINAELVRDFTRVAGTTKIEVLLTESGKQNTTFCFYLEVVASAINGAIESSNTVTIIEELDNKILESKQLIETGYAATKEDIAQVNSQLEHTIQQVNGIDRGIGETYQSISDLQIAYPLGDTKRYVTADNGHWYFWNGTDWKDGGIFQGIGIEDKSITPLKTDFVSLVGNLFDKTKATNGFYVEWWNGDLVANSSFYTSDYIPIVQNEEYIISNKHNLAFFNYKKEYISGLEQDDISKNGSVYKIAIPSNARFIRVSVRSIWINDYVFSKSTYDNREPGVNIEKLLFNDKSVKGKWLEILNYKNLFNVNSSKNVEGYFMDVLQNTGLNVKNPDFIITHPILLKKYETYTINNCRNYAFFDYNLSYIPNSGVDNPTEESITFTTTQDCTLKYSVRNNRKTISQIEIGNSVTSFIKFGNFEIPNLVFDKGNLSNKKILNLGDSIGAGDGNNGVGYAEIIAKNENMFCYDYAVGGATIGMTENNNIITYMENAIKAGVNPDYVLVNGGTNDIGEFNVPIGVISDGYTGTLDKTTFSGGLEYIFKTLKNTFLNSKIIYIRVHNMDSRDVTKQKIYGERAIDICEKWSIPYVDMYKEGGLNSNLDTMKKEFTNATVQKPNGDGTHPNAKGYNAFYVPLITNKLKIL